MKKYILILATIVYFGVCANAQCVTASLKGSQWSPNCTTNYLELKNKCSVSMVVAVKYFDTDRNKWVKETAYVYPNSTYGICFNGTKYEILSQKEAEI